MASRNADGDRGCPIRRIRIVGAAGAGKTYLARRLGIFFGIEPDGIDEMIWKNSPGSFNIKRSSGERDAALKGVLARESWILEGMRYGWDDASFFGADIVIHLALPPATMAFRLVKRFFRRKRGLEQNRYSEKIWSLAITLWRNARDARGISDFVMAGTFGVPVIVLRSQAEVEGFLSGSPAVLRATEDSPETTSA